MRHAAAIDTHRPVPTPCHTHHTTVTFMCPGPEASRAKKQLLGQGVAAAAADAATLPAREGNGKEEGVWDFFRSYTDEPHRSRCVDCVGWDVWAGLGRVGWGWDRSVVAE